MANQNTISIEIKVDDKGTATIKQFGAESEKSLKGVEQVASRTAGGMDALKKSWTDLAVAGAAAWMLVSQAMEYVEKGAKAQQAEQSFRDVATAAGESADKIIEAMKRAAAGTVDDSDIMQKAVKGMMLGFSGDQMTKIMEMARVAARMTGEDVKTAYEKITDAIATNMPRALKQYGLITKEEISLVNKAMAAGVEDVNLMGLAMANHALRAAKLGPIYSDSAEKMQIFKAQISETKEVIGGGLIVALDALYRSFQYLAAGVLGLSGNMAGLASVYARYRALVYDTMGDEKKAAENRKFADEAMEFSKNAWGARAELIREAGDALLLESESSKASAGTSIAAANQAVAAEKAKLEALIKTAEAEKAAAEKKKQATEQAVEAIRKANVEIESIGKDQYDKDIVRINSEAQKYRDARVGEITIANFVAAETTAAKKKQAEETKKIQFESTEAYLLALEKETEAQGEEMNKRFFAEKAGAEEYRKMVAEEYDFAATENERAINKIIADAGEKEVKLKKLLDDGFITEKQYADQIIAINANKNAAILEKEEAREKAINDIELGIYTSSNKYGDEAYEATVKRLMKEVEEYEKLGVSIKAIQAHITTTLLDADLKRAASSDKFFDGLIAAYKKDTAAQKTWGQMGIAVYKDIDTAKTDIINSGVTAFLKGEDAKLAIQQAAGDAIVNIAGKYATAAYNTAIEKTISIIGAYIGEGAAGSGAKASQGGAWAAVGEVALYLGTAVAAMLGGRALAQQFRAEGGWIGSHPGGGAINQGSGTRDDVYLGRTENTRHWGMGGEFVVNKESTLKYADLLVAINKDRLNFVTDTGFAEGGWTGHRGQQLVGDPDVLATNMALGGQMSFMAAFGKAMGSGSDLYGAIGSGIGETIVYIVSAMGGALSGKLLGNSFRAEGGPVKDMGHFNFGSLFIPPGFPDPFAGGKIVVMPGMYFNPNPSDVWEDTKKWISDQWDEFLNSQRAGWRNFAEVILTPGDMSMDPIDGLVHEVEHFGNHLWEVVKKLVKPPGISFAGEEMAAGGFFGARPFSALNGLDYVPRDNFPIRGHQGEAVLDKEDAQEWRGGKGRGDITLQFHYHGTVIDGKRAAREMASMVYPELHKLQSAWRH